MRSKRGFTLVEMLLVVAIIVILSGVAIIGISTVLDNKQQTASELQGHAGLFEPAASQMIENLKNLPGPPTAEAGISLTTTASSTAESATVPSVTTTTLSTTTTTTRQTTRQTQQTTQQTQQTQWSPSPTPTPTPVPRSVTTSSSSSVTSDVNQRDTYNHCYRGGSMTVSASGGITSIVLTLPAGATFIDGVNPPYPYSASASGGNSVTITYNGTQWTTPATSLNISGITWRDNSDRTTVTVSASITHYES